MAMTRELTARITPRIDLTFCTENVIFTSHIKRYALLEMKKKKPAILLLLAAMLLAEISVAQTVDKSTFSSFHCPASNDTLRIAAGQVMSGDSDSPKVLHGYYPLHYSLADLTNYKFEQIVVFPNPFNESFQLQLETISGEEEIKIYNALGQLVYRQPISVLSTVPTEQIKSGIYFVHIIRHDEVLFQTKIIKH
jgi:hypothetical protein